MRKIFKLPIQLGLVVVFSTSIGYSQSSQSVFFLGDAGATENTSVLQALGNELSQESDNSFLIFLGDNIYPAGLPDSTSNNRLAAESRINTQLGILNNYKGTAVFIPGERDWAHGGRAGYHNIIEFQAFIDSLKNDRVIFLPGSGCPGPEEIELSEDLVLLVIDTQWLLHSHDKPKTESDCYSKNPSELLYHLQESLELHRNKTVIVATHHPVHSVGVHGTKSLGSRQDLSHPLYKIVSRQFEKALARHPNIIHLSSHDNSLQYIKKGDLHFMVSGSSSKQSKVSNDDDVLYASSEAGYGKLSFTSTKTALQFKNGPNVLHSHDLEMVAVGTSQLADNTNIDFQGQSQKAKGSIKYNKKSGSYWLFGRNYRDVWNTEIEARVFDIGNERGGLTIVKPGGGFATNSLRLEAKDGKQYVLRSIDKYPERGPAIPELLKQTVAADLIKDQISSNHPYSAFVIPPMADAAGVYHTNPELVYLPDDPRLGQYREKYAGELYLYEERPAGDWEGFDHFGGSDKIVSTIKMLEKIYDDNDNRVDQKWVVKSRLFDVFLGDWDRHDDQWRWASFKEKKGRMYRPIPRDRDQAFFINQGAIMNVVGRKWAQPKFQGYDMKFKNPEGFVFNARYFDRDFMNELSRQDWIDAAEELQRNLTDNVIESAVARWPQPIYEKSGADIIAKLKSQRGHLVEYANTLYEFFAETVTVRGSNKKEYFKVERLDDENTRVRMYKNTNKNKQDKLMYDRTFKRSETKEIRLYGLKGKDEFEIEGAVNKGIKIRVIGGTGKDIITDNSSVSGASKKTRVYDKEGGATLNLGKEAKDLTSDKPGNNDYIRKEFKYDKLIPLVVGKIDADDGLFLGGGFLFTNHGFRKEPFKSSHLFMGSVALATASFDFTYNATFTEAVGPFNFKLGLRALSPNSVTNYFGIGNESNFDQNAEDNFNVDRTIDFYRTRFLHYSARTQLEKRFNPKVSLSFGPHFQAFQVDDDYDGEDRFILNEINTNGRTDLYDWKTFFGGEINLNVDTRDSKGLASRGILWNTRLGSYAGVSDMSDGYSSLSTDFAFYASVGSNKITFTSRFGAGHNFGNYEFYQAQILDGNTELRGYRKFRFYGDSKAFNNTELRLKLFNFQNRVAPGTVGITLFNDVGRVWVDVDPSTVSGTSDKWHHGYGAGLWYAPLNVTTIGLDLSMSEEETLAYFRIGFRF